MSPTPRTLLPPLAVLAAALALAACGGDDGTARAPEATTARPKPRPHAPRCPDGAGNCSAASGRVIALESVDADGDGDLHLILASRQSITFPGVTVLDVNRDLRPKRDPRVGDWAAGAGPVYQGSYGQSQIQVERIVYAPKR